MKSWKILTASMIALSLSAYGCDRDNRPAQSQSTPPAAASDATQAANTAIAVEEVAAHPEKYLGQELTVIGEVDEVLSPMAFALDEDAPFAAGVDNDVLVFYPRSAELQDLDDAWLDDKVRVTGTVGRMTVVEIEKEVGWDLDPKIEARVEKQGPIIIAKKVDRVP